MADRLRVGVIGLRMGRSHVAGYAGHPSSDVIALCDTDAARLRQVANEFGVKATYADYRSMLDAEKLDVVSVATPNVWHKAMTIDALAAGCHVLCEKPMAMNAAEGEEMLAASRRHGRRLMIHFNRRFAPISHAARQLIASGRLGEVYFVRTIWHRRSGVPWWYGNFTPASNGGGPLVDLGVHMLDLGMWLAGYPDPTCVLAATWNPIAPGQAEARGLPFTVEDFGAAMIRLANGAMVELEASWASHRGQKDDVHTRVHGTKGGLMIGSRGNQVFLELDGAPVDVQWNETGVPPCPGPCHAFADAILNDLPTPVTAEQGLTVTRILDAVYESARTGHPVSLP